MAYDEGESRRRRRRRHSSGSDDRRRRGGDIEVEGPTLDELRDIRNDLYTSGKRRSDTATRMQSTTSRTTTSPKASSKHKHRSRHEDAERSRHRRRATETEVSEYVYAPKERRERRYRSEDEDDLPVIVEEPRSKERRIRVIYVDEEKPRRHSRRDDEKYESSTTLRRSTSRVSPTRPLELLKRTLSGRDVYEERPPLRRSQTISTARTAKAPYDASVSNATTRRSTFMGLFAPPPAPPRAPVRMVQCLTCMDDVPHSKSAKLKCGHRMCHSCLKRIFKMSVNDPQHMPPKCCTSEHIPLKHVDRLFDTSFKILWNKKFQEYSTKNRIYCPARRCGEWIRPANIHTEGGKKFGKCGRCKTKVCCLCNGKWHGNKECPKDEETNALLEAAKQAGWQRCFNCRTMVELKEGCNHMTCRCNAEFCMICGLKWKTCNCPWFNYETVEADRLQHMQVPMAAGRRPPRYDEEIAARRRQEAIDADLARRVNAFDFQDPDDTYEDYNGDVGAIHGIGVLDHHMNETYQRPVPLAHAAANYAVRVNTERVPRQPPIPQVPRRPPRSRVSEVVVEREPPRERIRERKNDISTAVLAGLEGARRGNRVNAWRNYITPTAPEEGVLSIV